MSVGHVIVSAVLALLVFGMARLVGVRSRLRRKLKSISGFKPAMVRLGGRQTYSLAIDPGSRRFAIAKLWGRPQVFDFSDLVAVEILRNGDALSTTDRGSQLAGAVVGALLAGAVGLLVGGLSGNRRQSQKISQLSLRIVANDLGSPSTEVVFFRAKGAGVDPGSRKVQKSATQLSEWHGRFQAILHSRGSTATTTSTGLAVAPK